MYFIRCFAVLCTQNKREIKTRSDFNINFPSFHKQHIRSLVNNVYIHEIPPSVTRQNAKSNVPLQLLPKEFAFTIVSFLGFVRVAVREKEPSRTSCQTKRFHQSRVDEAKMITISRVNEFKVKISLIRDESLSNLSWD